MFKVCDKPCDQCLFSKNRIVSASRMKQILSDCRKSDTHFICHKATIAGNDICCHGFYHTQTSNLIRIAQRLRMVEMVNVEKEV